MTSFFLSWWQKCVNVKFLNQSNLKTVTWQWLFRTISHHSCNEYLSQGVTYYLNGPLCKLCSSFTIWSIFFFKKSSFYWRIVIQRALSRKVKYFFLRRKKLKMKLFVPLLIVFVQSVPWKVYAFWFRVAIWPFLKRFSRNKMIWPFGLFSILKKIVSF